MATGRVLVVEDDEGWHRSLVRRIERTGYSARGAYTCEQAQAIVRSEELFNLLIVDVHLPDGYGFDLVPLFKQRNPQALVLVTSGLPCGKAARLAREAGADRFSVSTIENIDKFLRGDPPERLASSAEPTLEQVKADYVNTVLLDVRGNRTLAAQILGIKRQSLQRMLRKSVPVRE